MHIRMVQCQHNGKWYLIDRLKKLTLDFQRDMYWGVPISVFDYINMYLHGENGNHCSD
jgi:hypothetical protein